MFDTAFMKWTELTSSSVGVIPQPRYDPGFVSLNGILYLVGGSHGNYTVAFGKLPIFKTCSKNYSLIF